MHSIFYDEIHDELIVPNAFSLSILTFRGGANGEEAPIRVIQGPLTGLIDSDLLDVDPIHNEIFVPVRNEEGGAIHVFARDAVGNVAPIRKIEGPDTGLARKGGEVTVTVDPAHDLLFVSSSGGSGSSIAPTTATSNRFASSPAVQRAARPVPLLRQSFSRRGES